MVGVTQVWKEPITPLISLSNPLYEVSYASWKLFCDLQTCGRVGIGFVRTPRGERRARDNTTSSIFTLKQNSELDSRYFPGGF